ncbi:hypothetical protein BGW36DRAFT_111895 [Talaromyces proteolyticus]|uniref:Uncharacterized protein n=1 Tax=Talaromyces proteolyticus TaxID=1131652 RepID=A0AAD4KX68_9EURO|nr:uncharacterized protein BGW36DRAFT_111895 [Talaromyces proteolyticus]KAH8702144.1 hypothetical protein BGW36DRAFT_111895 [Talaromyces proteolyticus]
MCVSTVLLSGHASTVPSIRTRKQKASKEWRCRPSFTLLGMDWRHSYPLVDTSGSAAFRSTFAMHKRSHSLYSVCSKRQTDRRVHQSRSFIPRDDARSVSVISIISIITTINGANGCILGPVTHVIHLIYSTRHETLHRPILHSSSFSDNEHSSRRRDGDFWRCR